MEEIKEKKLLYYDFYRLKNRTYKGASITYFEFKDLKTGERITLGTCYYNEELSARLGEHFYNDIEDATVDYDILWRKTSFNFIDPVAETFEEVKKEYDRMIAEGVSMEEINSAMILLYQGEAKTKKKFDNPE